ncbi:MAG TPA: diaminopimelate epimerase [Chitinophagales bacterium]|nr:diaminopimelate epimerase [Chitinophagales bacterium]
MHFNFQKYQGTGNDFVILDNRDFKFPKDDIQLIERICDRRFGVGADGLMLVENADGFDFRMVYYNSDGRQSTMCGNGGRCIAAFVMNNKIAGSKGQFIAIDGPHDYVINEEGLVKLNMIDVNDIELSGEDYILFTGSPHYVKFVDDLQNADMYNGGKSIRYNDRFKQEGINVNFVEKNEHTCALRTYERGVEDETYSCGTGTVAAALSIAEKFNMHNGPIHLETKGGLLNVYFEEKDGAYSNIWLEGPVKFVFDGVLDLKDFKK